MHRQGKQMDSPLAQLNLTHIQTETIRKLRIDHEQTIAPLRNQENQLRAELDILWLQLTPDAEKIKSVQKKIHDIRFKILEKETEFRLAVRKTLTEDQLSRFLAFGIDRCPAPEEIHHRPPRP